MDVRIVVLLFLSIFLIPPSPTEERAHDLGDEEVQDRLDVVIRRRPELLQYGDETFQLLKVLKLVATAVSPDGGA